MSDDFGSLVNDLDGLRDSGSRLTLSALIDEVSTSSIENLYDTLKYDYAKSVTLDVDVDDPDRDHFLQSLAWRIAPTPEYVRRVFNQINSFYAERWLLDHPSSNPSAMLEELNRRLLFRQGKLFGHRKRGIGYGYRVHLDFMDPFRRMKWLAGAAPQDIDSLLTEWSAAVELCEPSRANALALAMFLIAIHPFVDGNGRSARLVYTWLCERWQLDGDNWFEEGSDGELLRTGHGVRSTEYTMAQFMISLGGGANVIDPGAGKRSSSDDARMAAMARQQLRSLQEKSSAIVSDETFQALLFHLQSDGHFRATTPRFESLRSLLW